MISVEEAKSIIRANINSLPAIQLNLDDAVGFALHEDVISPIDMPSFVQSSMDGYAFAFDDVLSTQGLKVTHTIQAGASDVLEIKKNEAVRIFTGAPLPQGADTVLMQEKAKLDSDQLFVLDERLQKCANARSIGADIQKGAIAIKKNTILTPGAIGFLASLGITQVTVVRKPSICIILTGNELQDIGKQLSTGQIYESNSHTLRSALRNIGFNNISVVKVEDDLASVATCLKNALEKFDLIIFTGGISVGDYDFVLEACNMNHINQLFHKVKQKPGKPLYIGKKENSVVCALPGNPASVLSCFYHYVTIVLDQLCKTNNEPKLIQANLSNAYKKPLGLTHFLKGMYDFKNNKVTLLDGQESFKMSAFAIANCFIELPETITEVQIGQLVKVHLF